MAFTSVAGQVLFTYRSTFIDEERCGDECSPKRSRSFSPVKTGLETAAEAVKSETALSGYVQNLVHSAQRFRKFGKVAFTSSTSQQGQGQPSVGSTGHPQLCRRPCVYFAVGECSSGSSCLYCHHSHPERSVKLDKAQRRRFQELDVGIVLGMLHDLMCTQAREHGFSDEAGHVLALVEGEARTQNPEAIWAEEAASLGRLQRAFKRMPFNQLAAYAGSKLGDPAFSWKLQAVVDKLSERVEALQQARAPVVVRETFQQLQRNRSEDEHTRGIAR
mmetsp:Transcript_28450/g.66696  ORF Transcript_28450/g.66696 Transcript_28450/m.66696 type:complete len:275 (+) Transcript_28450:38-862(+)